MASTELLKTPPGATDIPAERLASLVDKTLTRRAEVNAREAANILEAERWLARRKSREITSDFVRKLHRQMFGRVWLDAGKFRTEDTNIGIEHWKVPMQVEEIVRDVNYWIEHRTYLPDELAARFHHRLVFVHPFWDGNGRHTRLIADYLLSRILKVDQFS